MEEKLFDLYYNQHKSLRSIEKLLEIKQSQILKVFKERNWTRRTKGAWQLWRRSDVSFFKDINSEEKAYWLGFVYADGNLTDDNFFNIALQSRDASHLKKLADHFNQPVFVKERYV